MEPLLLREELQCYRMKDLRLATERQALLGLQRRARLKRSWLRRR